MKYTVLLIGLLLTTFFAKSQLQLDLNGKVGVGTGPDFYANLNIAPQYASPGSTNLIIGNWWNNTKGLISIGVHDSYSWIQSWHTKPLHINRVGCHTIFGSESVESVGIGYGMLTPSAKLHVIGNIYATGTITSSDERLKTNIETLNLNKWEYNKLNPVTYKFNVKDRGFSLEDIDTSKIAKIDKDFYKRDHIGFIAQEVKEILPDLVYEDNEGYLAIDYQGFIPILFQLVKNQQAKIENLEGIINVMQDECCSSSIIKSASASDEESINPEISELYQNTPNPFSNKTQIRYFLNENANNAAIYIYDMSGVQIKKHLLNQKGFGNIIIYSRELKAGMYMYSMVIDNKLIDVKKMILTD